MAHINERLPENVEIDALRRDPQDGLEVVRQDNLRTVRNTRVDSEPIQWEIAFPVTNIEGTDTAEYVAVRAMWQNTERGLHTFNFKCFVDNEVHKVRFDSPLETAAPAGHLRKYQTMTIVEDE
jgi:hypothetical protein